MLLSLLMYLLSSNAVTLRRNKSILFSRFVLSSLILISICSYSELYIEALSSGIGLYGGLFNITTLTMSFNIFILVITSLILGLTSYFSRKVMIKEYSSLYYILQYKLSYNKYIIGNKAGEQFRIIEYALIIVFILCGALFLISTADLVSIFLSIELQSYGLYILSTIYRNSESATRNGLTYFLLGGMSSCFILLGSALLYANSGTTSLDNIYIISSISEAKDFYNIKSGMVFYEPYYFHTALIILCVGFLFKVSAAPFHFWSPDVYDGIPTIVTTFVAIIAKISIFVFLLELVYYTSYYFFNFSWKLILIMSSMLSLIVGSVLGLTQFRIKRLFAYSTISHVGFILLSLAINSTESIQSYIFYILQYSVSNLNAFIILVSIGYTFYFSLQKKEDLLGSDNINKKRDSNESGLLDENNSPVQLISQIKGYFYVNPYIALSLAITLFSFVGIPPLIGFFAKQMVLSAALDSGYYFITFVAILTSVIGAGYYLNLIKEIFFYKNNSEINCSLKEVKLNAYLINAAASTETSFDESTSGSAKNKLDSQIKRVSFSIKDIRINSFLSTTISTLTLLLLLFIYMPDPWLNIVSILSLMLFKS